jgi:hypothetical protein
MRKATRFIGVGLGIALALAGVAWATTDFGAQVQQQVHSRSNQLFGVTTPLEQSSTTSIAQQVALANPLRLVSVARDQPLRVRGIRPQRELVDVRRRGPLRPA